ncbi:hypothetical protein RFI_34173 [Reticulomyxa filosa]|uniref:Uncharacterized protein n=1 Tax=Reticulomyxa filosa TaxID=46433 RepID=X6LQ14_RETFI|nr:hypothetical protein RFI_34173 [Reticulomyxa filosa]|eukprot:ETO03237.1 hypothetical protein RFI_34173 [Reticulomyxa filosa]
MVNRLTPISSSNSEYFEMNLVIGHEDHSMYLSLCKTSIYILIRIDNRLMKTIPSDTHLNKIGSIKNKDCTLIKPCNDINVKHKEWLKYYIKDAFILRNNKSSEVMKHLYCSNIFPCKEKLPSIVENWSYRPAQGNAENCYLRNHNIGYRIRLGDIIS